MGNVKIANTPYDDVFRTLVNDCSPLIIPVTVRFIKNTVQKMRCSGNIIQERKESSSHQMNTS